MDALPPALENRVNNDSGQRSMDEASLERLIEQLSTLRNSLLSHERDLEPRIGRVHRSYRMSAVNLVHYLAMRRHDIRVLQDELAALGLSSLGRSECHVMATLEAVLNALRHLAGAGHAGTRSDTGAPGFREGRSLLASHTDSLFGPAPRHRSVRVIVTMSRDAADDYPMVRALVAQGMDCMRINCAHDTPDVWLAMIEHLRRARRELGRECRILIDLAGPKLRTGPLEPGPQVVVWHPRRDIMGQVIHPARIWITPADSASGAPPDADAVLPVDSNWLAEVKAGERIHFKDARGKRRVLEVIGTAGASRWARCEQTAYVTPQTVLLRVDVGSDATREGRVASLPPREEGILLRKGDFLVLTREPVPGHRAQLDAEGRLLTPAVISCTLPEVFPQVRRGERIWFDDGRIGGIIRENEGGALRVEITQAREKGDRLLADKGINLPDTRMSLPAITERDIEDLKFVGVNADLVGMSFVRRARDVENLYAHLGRFARDDLGVVLKIETREAFEHLPAIILAAMQRYPVGVMIARGDLAVECGYERMAEVQEEILWICEAAHIPVIWATQVLESLAKKGQPSRAEITDAAMGERAECVMLNKGPHILAALNALDDILRRMQEHQSKKSSRLRRLHLSAFAETEEC